MSDFRFVSSGSYDGWIFFLQQAFPLFFIWWLVNKPLPSSPCVCSFWGHVIGCVYRKLKHLHWLYNQDIPFFKNHAAYKPLLTQVIGINQLSQTKFIKNLVCHHNCYMYNALCATGNICPRKVNLICGFVAFIYQFTSYKFRSIPLFIITIVQHQKPGNMKGPGDCEFCSDNKEASRFDKPLSFPALFDHGISRKNIGWEDVRCMQWWGTTSQWTAAEGPHHVNTPINALLQYTLLLENNCFIMPPVRFCTRTLER